MIEEYNVYASSVLRSRLRVGVQQQVQNTSVELGEMYGRLAVKGLEGLESWWVSVPIWGVFVEGESVELESEELESGELESEELESGELESEELESGELESEELESEELESEELESEELESGELESGELESGELESGELESGELESEELESEELESGELESEELESEELESDDLVGVSECKEMFESDGETLEIYDSGIGDIDLDLLMEVDVDDDLEEYGYSEDESLEDIAERLDAKYEEFERDYEKNKGVFGVPDSLGVYVGEKFLKLITSGVTLLRRLGYLD